MVLRPQQQLLFLLAEARLALDAAPGHGLDTTLKLISI